MKGAMGLCLVAVVAMSAALAQEQAKPPIKHGVQVEMATASHATPIPEADEQSAIVVSVTADGKAFVGVTPVDMNALSNLDKGIIYVKADARTPYQKILAVLDAFHGRTVVLLTKPASHADTGKIVPADGMRVTVGQ